VVYRSNGDGCWARVTIPTVERLWGVWGNARDVFAVGDLNSNNNTGVVLHSVGGAWLTEPTGMQPALYGLTGVLGRVWATGAGSNIILGNP
jgi:hypothetical protein